MEGQVVGRGSSAGQIEQFVSEILLYSSQYGNSSSISYTAVNLIGKPRVFPRYGDSHEAYSPRTYGPWWDMSPFASQPIQTQNMVRIQTKDFVVVSFEVAVFPSQVSIYETFNPGSVVRIWASTCVSSSHNEPPDLRWQLLYKGEPQTVEKRSRIFSPPLRNIPFPTRTLRLDLDHRHLDYHCQLDAVRLTGFQPGQMGLMATLHLTDLARVKPAVDRDVDPALPGHVDIQQACLLSLPSELVRCVLARLDLVSLARLACTCRRLQTLAYDWSLYARLDLRDQWHCANAALRAIGPRCQRITALHLQGVMGLSVGQFLSSRGAMLTSLALDSCMLASAGTLPLGSLCPNLRQLALRGLPGLPAHDSLSGLRGLTSLDLYRSAVGQQQLLAALEQNPGLQHLNLGSCQELTDWDAVASTLANSNAALVSLDAWKSKGWSVAGLGSLARLTGLQELDLGWSLADDVGGLLPLINSCRELRKLGLAACRGTTDSDLLQLAQNASHLQQLDLTGVKGLSETVLERALHGMPRLRLLDLSFCGFQPAQLSCWQQAFPSLQINAAAAP